MKLIGVEMRGFRLYPELHLEFNGCQLIRISGRNGAGKSTIVESLEWTLFGRLRARDTILAATHRGRHRQQRAPEVTWIVELECGTRFEFIRWRGGARVQSWPAESWPVPKTGPSQVTSFMAEKLGIQYDDLRATAWCLQGDVRRPVAMAKQKRRGLIRRLLLEERGKRYRRKEPGCRTGGYRAEGAAGSERSAKEAGRGGMRAQEGRSR